MTVRVLALQSGVTDLVGHRYHESAGFAQAGVGNARSGLIPTAGAADVSQVSAMVVAVAGFAAWIDGTASASQAGYNVVSDAPTQFTIADGEASVARTDRIWAVVYQDTYDGSGQTKGAVEYAKGQATGMAAPLPESAILLWEFSVPAGTSAATGGVPVSSFVDKRTYTAAAGGIIPAVSQADRDGIANPYKGMAVWRQEYGHLEIWDNEWRPQGVPALTGLSVATGHLTDPADGALFFARDNRSLYQYDASAGQWRRYTGKLSGVCTSDTPNITSTTAAPVSQLQISVPAGPAVYAVEAMIIYEAGTAGDLTTLFTFPSGASLPWGKFGYSSSPPTVDPFAFGSPTSGSSFFTTGGTGAGNQLLLRMSGTLTMGSTAGTVGVSAGRAASDSTPAIIKKGSRLTLEPLS